jgi:hypothetical protein
MFRIPPHTFICFSFVFSCIILSFSDWSLVSCTSTISSHLFRWEYTLVSNTFLSCYAQLGLEVPKYLKTLHFQAVFYY